MNKFIFSLTRWLALAVSVMLATPPTALAAGPLETSGNVRWIIFASRQNVDEAIGLARRFGSQFGPPSVVSTSNGWYAVVAGPLAVSDTAAIKKKLSDAWWPPKDALFSKGPKFIEKVWERPKSPVLAWASSSDTDPHVAFAAGLEARVELTSSRKIVRVRSGGMDVASAPFDDDSPYNSTGVSIARLDPSSSFPQVVVTHFTGGAHCCTVMKVLTFINGRWTTVDVGQFDVDGPQIDDLNGDGAAELIGKDDSFDYAFAPYAGSRAPPKILKLVGGRIMDVSQTEEFRRPLVQMLLADQGLAAPEDWRQNGFLAGWVAHNAMVGNGAEAWRKMLELFDRNSDWDLSVCTIATKDFDPCPEYAKRKRDFPTALREHLAKNGYSLEGIAPASSATVSPSFDCNKARTPTEIAICRSPRLSELDNILAAGYAFIKSTRGRPTADAIGIPYWKLRAQCEGDEACIARRDTEEISVLALAGAPVSLPTWASASSAPPQPPPTNPPPPAPAVAIGTDEPKPAPTPNHKGSSGTGFFVTPDGAAVTNAHVVEDCSDIRVTTDQGVTAPARIIARDVRNDLALLSTGLAARRSAAFRTSIRLGDGVEVFGYPLTSVLAKAGNFTLGNVSALVGIGEDSRYLQIRRRCNPGTQVVLCSTNMGT